MKHNYKTTYIIKSYNYEHIKQYIDLARAKSEAPINKFIIQIKQ